MLRSKKAISPILATLLLIVIAVAAIVVTYAWVMTYMTSAGQQAGVRLFKANVNFYAGGTKIAIYIGNSGTSDTEIIKVYVGSSVGSRPEIQPNEGVPIPLAAEDIATATVDYNWTSGATYHFLIVSSSGQTLEWADQAPA